jgi:hypothetical protein
MLTTRRSFRSPIVRPTVPETSHDESFPRAIAGEDYDRYARAMAKRADQWVLAHLSRLNGSAIEVQEFRDRLRQAAVVELHRDLYGQEERLLSEVLQRHPDATAPAERVEPEIPSFLLRQMAS